MVAETILQDEIKHYLAKGPIYIVISKYTSIKGIVHGRDFRRTIFS